MLSNCQIYAWREFTRRHAIWRKAGRPRGERPWIKQMPSNLEPHWIPHAQVGGAGLPTLEFVPLDTSPLPWWLAWTALLFRGRVRPAEFPITQPSQHGALKD